MLKRDGRNECGVVLDAQASAQYSSMRVHESPCLTKARGSTGHYLLEHERFTTIHEHGGLQGFSKEHVDIYLQATSATKLGQGFGDAMSLNLLIRILAVALPACQRSS